MFYKMIGGLNALTQRLIRCCDPEHPQTENVLFEQLKVLLDITQVRKTWHQKCSPSHMAVWNRKLTLVRSLNKPYHGTKRASFNH